MKKIIMESNEGKEGKEGKESKLAKIPIIYIVFPPLGLLMLIRYFLNQFNKKRDNKCKLY